MGSRRYGTRDVRHGPGSELSSGDRYRCASAQSDSLVFGKGRKELATARANAARVAMVAGLSWSAARCCKCPRNAKAPGAGPGLVLTVRSDRVPYILALGTST